MGGLFRQYWTALSCSLSVFMSGTGFVWFAPIMVQMASPDSPVPMTTDDLSWVVSAVEFGEILAPIPAGLLADRIGRKPVILATGPMCLLGWALIALTRSLPVIYLVRILHGTAVGIVYTVVPMYLAEISEPKIRGELTGHFQTLWYAGVLFAYLAGSHLSYDYYAVICAVLPFIFTLTFLIVPESPFFHLLKNKRQKAERSLQWLRGTEEVETELKEIEDSVKADLSTKKKSSWRSIFASSKDRKALLIVQIVCATKYMNGSSAVTCYVTQTFAFSSHSVFSASSITIYVGVILTLSSFLSAYLVDRIGRRPILLISAAGTMLFNLLVGMYFFLDRETNWDLSKWVWGMYACFTGYLFLSSAGLGPILQTIQAEYFGSHVRATGGAITGITGTVTTFVVLKQYQVLEDLYGVYLNYWVFSFFALVGTITFWFVIPETKGRTLAEIQQNMRKKKKIVDGPTTIGVIPVEDTKPKENGHTFIEHL